MNSSSEITKASGSNFAPAFFFLPKAKRKALTTIYAYCRLTDDIVDKIPDDAHTSLARKELSQWKVQTEEALKGKASHPILTELSEVVRDYGVSPQDIFQLIDGVGMDLDKKTYPNFEELYPYCYGVASTVGLMSLPVFGAKNPRSKDYAINLGIAFQLTNILRDVRTDAEKGRIYIPQDDLKKFRFNSESWMNFMKQSCRPAGTKENENLIGRYSRESGNLVKLTPKPDSPLPDKSGQVSRGMTAQNKISDRHLVPVTNFKELILFEAKRADSFYRKAKENLTPEDRFQMLAPLMMTSVYHAILKKIVSNPAQVLERKISISKIELFFRFIGVYLKEI